MTPQPRNTVTTMTAVTVLLIFSSALTAGADVETPRKQVEMGVAAEDVVCREGKELVIRTNGAPACVKPETAQRMHQLGMLIVRGPGPEAGVPEETEREVRKVPAGSEVRTVPASDMTVVNFYVTDHDLNLAHRSVEVVPTDGLFEFTVSGIPVSGPESMIETGPDTGVFYVRLQLPETVGGRQLSHDDVVVIRYLDESGPGGEQRVLAKSVPLTSTFASVQTSGSGAARIGHEFTVRLYEPDANRDSRDEDKIPLSALEFRGEGGIRATLADQEFDANRSSLVETGPNTGTFEVRIKIPRTIDGETIHIGDWYEIRYVDRSTPSDTDEEIVLRGRIG